MTTEINDGTVTGSVFSIISQIHFHFGCKTTARTLIRVTQHNHYNASVRVRVWNRMAKKGFERRALAQQPGPPSSNRHWIGKFATSFWEQQNTTEKKNRVDLMKTEILFKRFFIRHCCTSARLCSYVCCVVISHVMLKGLEETYTHTLTIQNTHNMFLIKSIPSALQKCYF